MANHRSMAQAAAHPGCMDGPAQANRPPGSWSGSARKAGRALALGCALLPAAWAAASQPDLGTVQQALGGLSIPFEQNTGQFGPDVAYMARTFAGSVFVTQDGRIVYSLPGQTVQKDTPGDSGNAHASRVFGHESMPERRGPGWQLTESLPGAGVLDPQGVRPAAARVSHFRPQGSYQGSTWQSVMLGEPWPGIALELAARGNNVEKLFHVAPGADASRIAVQLEGATHVSLAADGSLVVGTGHGDISYTAPVAWQDIAGQRVPVAVRYALQAPGSADSPPAQRYGFALAGYDSRHPLVIDPLIQSTYLGGSIRDEINSLAIDGASGDVIVAGGTFSSNLPCTTTSTTNCANGAQPVFGGSVDGFVARLSGDLKTLRQATYLGGSANDSISTLALDAASGDVLVGGFTFSTNFPCATVATAGCSNGAQQTHAGGGIDGFVARLSGDLKQLKQATYLGGSGNDQLRGLAVDSATGDVVTGILTNSPNMPCTTTATAGCANAAQTAQAGGFDGFVTRLSGDLKSFRQSTYFGGSGDDYLYSLAIDSASGDVLVAGRTASSDLPCCSNGAQPALNGVIDGFVVRISRDLTTFRQGTYLGGADSDFVQSLAIDDASGDVIAAGQTHSENLPCTTTATPGCANGAQQHSGQEDGFVMRLPGDLQRFKQATYLGGSGIDGVNSIAIDGSSGEVLAGGQTFSTDLHCTTAATTGCARGAQQTFAGAGDGFIARLSRDLTTLRQSTYLGGSANDSVNGLAIDGLSGDVVAAGYSASSNLPCTTTATSGCANGAQPANAGSTLNGFVVRLSGDLQLARAQSITFAAQTTASRTFAPGVSFAISPVATASSGLAVSYSSNTAVCTVSGTTVTMVAAGTCTISAAQAGDADWQPAPPAAQTVVIVPLANTITFAAQAQASQTFATGATFAINPVATASSGLAVSYSSNAAVCTVSGTTVTMVAPGTCSITASQAGDNNHVAATPQSQSVQIVQAGMHVAIDSSPNPSRPGEEVTFTVTVTAISAPAAANPALILAQAAPVPTGNITLSDGTTTLGQAPLTNGVATLKTAVLTTTGAHSIVASYSGDTSYPAASSPALVQTVAAPAAPTPVPALGAWALLLLSALMASAAALGRHWRRKMA